MLTWNEENPLATGVGGNPERGLTSLGKKTISILEKKKMILDVSHLNTKSFWNVMDVATMPILASHSNAMALANVPRNLDDKQLLAIRDTNGLVGLNAFNLFIHDTIKEQTMENFIQHAVYIADKIGVEHLGFGFDFFEFLSSSTTGSFSSEKTSYALGLEGYRKVPKMIEKMREAGFTQKELELISRGNWHRLLKDITEN